VVESSEEDNRTDIFKRSGLFREFTKPKEPEDDSINDDASDYEFGVN
jgi:hypothetical protein